jgi:transcriptional regulator with XRE-family HTH domain
VPACAIYGLLKIFPEASASLCKRFRQIRKEAGLTQQAFGEEINVGLPYVKAIEQGRFAPSHQLILEVSKKFRRSLNWLYGVE